ncbi:HDOD domain-containing protein [bacterium]|nr:HDOD domain-containing protein [bacterium]
MTKRHILLVSVDADESSELAAQLDCGNSTWHTTFAGDESAAVGTLLQTNIDALIADGSLPGASQESLLKRASELRPATFRLSLSGNYDHGIMLRTMGFAHQNLWKPCPASEIQSTIARAFALRETLQNDRLRLLIAQINTLPSLPRLYLDFLDEIRKPSPSTARLSDIIRQDLSLCSKLLQLVNSAFFGLPHKIDNPEEALLYLGLENVRALVLSIQVFSLFDQVKVAQFSLDALWDHSWAVGSLARCIAHFEKRPTEEIETAFTAGLLHDLGKLVLVNGIPRSWQQALESSKKDKLPLWQAERDHLGATHAETGAALLAMWGLSDQIVEAVAFHHEPEQSGSTSFCALTAVHAANVLLEGPTSAKPTAYLESVGFDEKRISAWRQLAADLPD